jgi:hypothetical protein
MARAGAIFHVAIAKGKFQGTIRPQSERLAKREAGAGRRDGDRRAAELGRGARVVLEAVGAEQDLAPRRGDRLSDVAALELGQRVGVLADERCEPEENGRALLRRAPFPVAAVDLVGGTRRAVHILGRRLSHRGDRFARRGVKDEAPLLRCPFPTLAAHQQARKQDGGVSHCRSLAPRQGAAKSGGRCNL